MLYMSFIEEISQRNTLKGPMQKRMTLCFKHEVVKTDLDLEASVQLDSGQ